MTELKARPVVPARNRGREKRLRSALVLLAIHQTKATRLTWPRGSKMTAMSRWSRHVLRAEPPISRGALKLAWHLEHAFSSHDGACWRKKAVIAEELGIHEDTVREALRELQERRFIVRVLEMRDRRRLRIIYPALPEEAKGGDGDPLQRGWRSPPPRGVTVTPPEGGDGHPPMDKNTDQNRNQSDSFAGESLDLQRLNLMDSSEWEDDLPW